MRMCRQFVCLIAFLTLGAAAPVAAQAPADPAALWTALARPAFDLNKVATVERVELRRDAALLTLASGQLALGQPVSPPAGEPRVFFAAFKGSGQLRLAPALPLEKQQLAFHSGQEALETEFTEGVFLFTDNTAEEFAAQANFRPGDPSSLQSLYYDRSERWTHYGLNWEPRLLKALLSAQPTAHTLFVAELKTRQHDWLTLVIDASDPEEVELWQFDPGRYSVSIWTKFPAGGRRPQEVFAHPLRHHELLLKGYRLDVAVEGSAELSGQAEVDFELRRAGERVLLFALDPNLHVSEVASADGQTLLFFQPRDPKDEFFLGDYLVVVAPEPFPAGPHTLRFRYSGKRIVRKEGPGTFFCQSFGWYPTYGAGRYSITTNEFAGRYDFDLTLRVPKKFVAVATGEKVEERKEEKYLLTRWKSEVPLAVAGFAFGDYKLKTGPGGASSQVEVYANRSPDDLLGSIQAIVSGNMPDAQSGLGGSPASALGNLAPSGLAEEMATEIGNSLRVFEKYFGPYPYKRLAVTNIPALYSYGQGWPTLLYVWALSFLDSYQRHQLGIRDHVQLTDFFRAHETSHQWWGHAVGWKSYHDQWLSEGFAEFSGILYTQYRRSKDEYVRLLRNNREQLLTRDRESAVPEQVGPLYAGLRLSSGKHPGAYSNVIYNKGGWVLHMLRMMLYDPRNQVEPDARFMAMMQEFTRTFQNQAASTEDFKAIVEKHMTPAMNLDGNGKMDWFFDSWVYGTGIPEYKLDYSVKPAAEPSKFVLSGVLRQGRVAPGFRTIVPLFVHQGDRVMRAGWLNVRGAETPFEVPLPFQPTKVSVNEWEDILALVK